MKAEGTGTMEGTENRDRGNGIFLTGGTGFLGTEIASCLAGESGPQVFLLTRAEDEEDAVLRLRAAWYHDKDLCDRIGRQFHPVPGDFTKPDLGLSRQDAEALKEKVSTIIHCGAEIGFQKDESELKAVNLEGTRNMLSFAKGIPGLRRFVHISTAYVAGQRAGRIFEEPGGLEASISRETPAGKKEISGGKESVSREEPAGREMPAGRGTAAGRSFSSLYEKSKAEAEDLVRGSGLPFSICRPGMIVGHSRTGRVKSFNTIYYVLKLYLLGRMPLLPIRPDAGLNIVPVDYVAESVIGIMDSREAEGRTFHLTCPDRLQPRAGELTDHVAEWAGRNLHTDLRRPRFLPMSPLRRAGLAYNRRTEGRRKGKVSNLLTLLPYFFSDQEFDRTNTDAVCGEYTLDWRDYIDSLLEFACRRNFMRQTGDTVFEQARVRRASRRYPVRYYDVAEDGIREVSGPEANSRIDRIRDALWAWGVRKGDRIALAGINSVDYMTLEQAIGRLGAVSVPIYYTTPADEISLLLARSGASWFFAGDRRIMEQIHRVETDARIVVFSAGLKGPIPRQDVLHWDAFLCGAKESAPAVRPDPEDLATIRFTSGTTGEPKGVMFSFAQLAWMGEVMTNLLPWEERNRSMRYLSFLPQSHVVEGILASYAPYYMLADARFYYLNDFGALTEALPKIRPSVFFSVPRFYEKLWDQFASTSAGKGWIERKDGPARRAQARILRRVLLRKAGLDACSQLIVGSAPVSEKLLRDFRALGIEIHNAYGQTEAPLITINRLGDNVIPTIGTPLPETEVTRAPDGELLVRGPQVTRGYYGLQTDTVRDGLLKTGDLGTIREDGHITLHGRKKEMIITAYGKNISIPKVEEALKNIPGISEAVLIGEDRPYCTALLWMEDGAGSPGGSPGIVRGSSGGPGGSGDAARDSSGTPVESPGVSGGSSEELDRQIAAMNEGLSHPEQIRRYRVIPDPLSIGRGELTPNLKVKRAVVEEHYREEIEEMYS